MALDRKTLVLRWAVPCRFLSRTWDYSIRGRRREMSPGEVGQRLEIPVILSSDLGSFIEEFTLGVIASTWST